MAPQRLAYRLALLWILLIAFGTPPASAQSVIAWGNNSYGQTNVPVGLSNVVAVAAGGYHCLALRSNGTVVGWGDNRTGQRTVPPDLRNVVALAAGKFHSLALRQDGTVVAWGGYPDGLGEVSRVTVPPVLSNLGVRAIAAGDQDSLALLADGTVIRWTLRRVLQPILGGGTVGMSCGGSATFSTDSRWSLGVRNDGTVTGWGYNEDGRLDGTLRLRNVVDVSAGGVHGLALHCTGTVSAWGRNHRGQTTVPAFLSNVVAVAAGAIHSLALKGDGTVVAWGAGETNTGTNLDYGQSLVPAGLSNVVAISAGVHFSVALLQQDSIPHPRLEIARGDSGLELRAHGRHGISCQLLRASQVEGPWLPTLPVTFTNALHAIPVPNPDAPVQFFRLRRQ